MESMLICGDSFSVDWSVEHTGQGWPTLLEQTYQVTNLSQAGCGEYKIYLQIVSVLDQLHDFDKIIISHTSPYRLYTKAHPIHSASKLHAHSDLLYQDIKHHSQSQKKLLPLVDYFENYFDLEYAEFTHGLICEKIQTLLEPYQHKTLHVSHIGWKNLYQFKRMIQFENLFETHPGLINHYSDQGNQLVYQQIVQKL
jgi:hypothetical protein